jgi:MFS family permease
VNPDPRRWRALALLAVVPFMVILDAQIVILALPSIERGLHFSADGAQWVLTAYLLGFGGLLLLCGRLGDLYGHRRLFFLGTSLFGLSSLICGLAGQPATLIAARAVQGLAAALMTPNALGIALTSFPDEEERNTALAVWGAAGGVGATAALLVGGVLTGSLGWQWIFLINVPVAVLLLAGGRALLAESTADARPAGTNPAGALTLTGALVCLCWAAVRAPVAGWGDPATLALLAAATLLAVLFVLAERRSDAPLVPRALARSRGLLLGDLVMLLAGMVAWGAGLLTSSFAQDQLGYGPLRYGLATIPLTVTAVAASFAAQALLPRFGTPTVSAASAGLLGLGSLWLVRVASVGDLGELLGALAVFGAGLGACTVAAAVAALSGVADTEAGVASGSSEAAFQLGGGLGAAVVTSVLVTHGLRAGLVSCVVLAAAAALVSLGLPRARSLGRDLGALADEGSPA